MKKYLKIQLAKNLRKQLQSLAIFCLVCLMINPLWADIDTDKDKKNKAKTDQTDQTDQDDQTESRRNNGRYTLTRGLTIGGSLRLRGESKQNFNFAGSEANFFLTQFRLSLKWQPSQNFSLFVEGQDSRKFGAEGISTVATPNIFQDAFDVHQAFADVSFKVGSLPIKVRAGRQKFNLGAQRLVASLEWVNTARVADGLWVKLGSKGERMLDLFSSIIVPVSPGQFNFHNRTGSRYFNSDFHGAYYTDNTLAPGVQFEGYWLLRHENQVTDDNVHTIGTRGDYKSDAFNADAEFAFQVGTFGGLDHQAWMMHAGISRMILPKTKLSFGYNYGSADSDPTDNKHGTFDNLFPLNHAYYGFMDFFSLQNVHNTEAIVNTSLFGKAGLRVAWQGVWLVDSENDAWYNAPMKAVRPIAGSPVSSDVGQEIDVTIKIPIMQKRVVFVLNYSHLFAGSYLEATGNTGDANFFFVMTKINF